VCSSDLHHSSDPVHFDKNFGASLALWDWLFGTLHIPQRQNEHIRFGTHGDAHLKRFIPSVLYPFRYAISRLIPAQRKNNPAPEADESLPIPTPIPTRLHSEVKEREDQTVCEPACQSSADLTDAIRH
jgi:hypothetical protein